MKCPRCKGFIVAEDFADLNVPDFLGWRCVNCGEVEDPVIQSHRRLPPLSGRQPPIVASRRHVCQ